MNEFSVYSSNGAILRVGVTCQDIAIQAGPDEFVMPGSYEPSEYWVSSGRAIPREDYALDVLPLPCTVWIEGQEYRCHEQPEFVFDAPGTYEIRVDAGPQYLEKVFQYDHQP